jgi:hypothetical protein
LSGRNFSIAEGLLLFLPCRKNDGAAKTKAARHASKIEIIFTLEK